MGGVGKMLMFAYKVGGWVWQNAYVITKITKKDQIVIGERLHEFALFEFLRERNSEMKEILNKYKKFGEAVKFRSHIGKWLIQDRGQKIFMEGVGFRKSYVIVRVGHGKCLRPITKWVGGVKKGQKNAYVIFEWSLS